MFFPEYFGSRWHPFCLGIYLRIFPINLSQVSLETLMRCITSPSMIWKRSLVPLAVYYEIHHLNSPYCCRFCTSSMLAECWQGYILIKGSILLSFYFLKIKTRLEGFKYQSSNTFPHHAALAVWFVLSSACPSFLLQFVVISEHQCTFLVLLPLLCFSYLSWFAKDYTIL